MSSIADKEDTFLGHPKGLFVLFFTEMWERFSYYGMRALLVLYIYASISHDRGPGLNWTKGEALKLYGWYVMLVYLMSIPGGIIADKKLGQKKAVMLGAAILVAGHGILAFEGTTAFFIGLGLIILGVGFLKPNISTMVGSLYKKGDIRRDKGFSIFYMGINLGSLLATLTIGGIADKWGWHAGFGVAGIAMFLGLIFYIAGQKHLKDIGNKPTLKDKKDDVSVGRVFIKLFKSPLHLVIVILLLAASFGSITMMDGVDRWGYVALYVFLSLFVGFMMMIYKDLDSKKMKDRFLVLILSFLLVIVFWGAFEQAGGLMSIYTEDKTNRMIGSFEIPTEMFQSLNALFILIFAIAVAGYWAKRKLKNKEASSLFKMAIGTIIMGMGFVFMVFAVKEYENDGASSMIWLVLAYLLHTIGELCSSPVSLSFITKLAPVKYASLMMGAYFAATGLGGKVAGVVGEAAQSEPFKIEFLEDKSTLANFEGATEAIAEDKGIKVNTIIYLDDISNSIVALEEKTNDGVLSIFKMKEEQIGSVKEVLKENKATKENPYHAVFSLEKDLEAAKILENKGDGKDYSGTFEIDEVQTKKEFKTFLMIFLFTLVFGLIVILLLKPLKRLTHGAEDLEGTKHDETEGFELAE